ncbi:hypothetical protein [Marinobacter adhaerens]|uniref:hypothetical protein n=1 Tax=Marinobacter adhaerens TaxID=1033846 RepID=UPI001C56D738|nr:hypothetical protein [Marinobacter adhaerens]MBW3225494.1 hypothetical protein [Marinobacter adhaerens]
MARTPGSQNIKPSKQAIAGYYKQLARAAYAGDSLAAGVLVINDTIGRHLDRERSDRIEREFLAMDKSQSVEQILATGKRRLMDLIEQLDDSEGQQRDAADLQQGQGPRDAAPADTTGQAGSAAGGSLTHSVSDSRHGQADEQLPHAEKGTE